MDPEDIRKLSIGAIWNFAKGTGLLFDPEDIRKLSIGAIWNFAKGTGLL